MKWSFVQNRAVKKDEDQTEKRKTAMVPKTLPDVGTRRWYQTVPDAVYLVWI